MEMGKTNKLKQEIEEYLTKDYCCEFKKECKDGVRVRCSEYEAKLYLILRFAALKEKRIEELVKENAELKADNDARKFAMAMSEKVEKQLRQKNAELKEKLKPENCLKLLAKEGYIKFTSEQLTKAKVALRKVVDYLGQFCSDYPDCVIEAENFLKDSEGEK